MTKGNNANRMTAPREIKPAARLSFTDALAVYLRPRVLIVLFLGFSSGLPLALSGSTLSAWMTESGVDIKTIGLFSAIGLPYAVKFLWAPFIDALDVPVLSRLLGRRRGWLLLSQLMLMAAIMLLAFCDPALSPLLVAAAALLVATASATQDIVVDAYRIESLPEDEQAPGMASYVAAYRVGLLVSGAGTLFLVSYVESGLGLSKSLAWTWGYLAMGLMLLVGVATTLLAPEPEKSAAAADHAARAGDNPIKRSIETAIASSTEFLSRDMAWVVLAFVALFKLADALASALTTPFVLNIGFSRTELATIIKGVGFASTLIGGYAGGIIARAYPLSTSLWIGGVLQTITILTFSWQAAVGKDVALLTFAITVESFTSAIGTVIFVAYLSALCGNPLHTATQYALLTALTALGRTIFSLGTGYVADATGWVWYFAICALTGIPSLVLLWWLQRNGHFERLGARKP
ncbi:MAG: transporter, family, beta-lactamase induction signal transducer AmpG [Alphaproteobacteria bacterium]|jgi:PAT family beta-lactamase induction signal transducer AmpG|nr:transporter, family, beta-lactamase induction signal transducer AmpG [Alphaproteobacteria bacterium]